MAVALGASPGSRALYADRSPAGAFHGPERQVRAAPRSSGAARTPQARLLAIPRTQDRETEDDQGHRPDVAPRDRRHVHAERDVGEEPQRRPRGRGVPRRASRCRPAPDDGRVLRPALGGSLGLVADFSPQPRLDGRTPPCAARTFAARWAAAGESAVSAVWRARLRWYPWARRSSGRSSGERAAAIVARPGDEPGH